MSEYAEFVVDDTGAKVIVAPEPPYIRYTPWEPTPGADLHTLAVKVAELDQRLARLESSIDSLGGVVRFAIEQLDQRLARLEGMTLQHSREL